MWEREGEGEKEGGREEESEKGRERGIEGEKVVRKEKTFCENLVIKWKRFAVKYETA